VTQEINPYQAPGGQDPVDRSQWTHSFVQMFRSFTRLKVSPPVSLTLPAEIRDTLLAWRGRTTREWLRYDLSRGSIWLWVAAGFFGLIFFTKFIPGPDGGFSLLNPPAAAAIGLAFGFILLRAAMATRMLHRGWFLVDIAYACLFFAHFVLEGDSIWWLVFILVLFLPSIVHALRRFKLHGERA